uniref:Retrotransposon gag domain-containing protein n=1 Tax=Chenopodium quinoa TaxID=63459 RepID=A0A803MTB6_CHEQI
MPPRNVSAQKEVVCRRRRALENVIISLANRSAAPSGGQSTFDRFDRHCPPTYDGTADPVVLEGWLREMEKLFNATGCPPEDRVAIGTYYLKLEADNCALFATKLKERFYPDELCWKKQEEFLYLSQGSLSIQEYTDRFTELSRFATSIIPTEVERVKRYIKKMDPRVRIHVLSSGVASFQGAYEIALSIHASIIDEEAAKVASARRPSVPYSQVPTKKPRVDNAGISGDRKSSGPRQSSVSKKCYRCGKDHHPGKNYDGTTFVCYLCKEDGTSLISIPRE